MKNFKGSLNILMTLALVSLPFVAASANAQDPQSSALMRGYRTGYSDGYEAGVSDAQRGTARDFRVKLEYQHGDRAYTPSYGSLEEYRDGYQQGFEGGYNAGYEGRSFDSTVPADLRRRSDASASAGNPNDNNSNTGGSVGSPNGNNAGNAGNPVMRSGNAVEIPRETIMRVELMNFLSSLTARRGDTFQARVIEPKNYQGLILHGYVSKAKYSGKMKDRALLQLSFDQARLPDGRSGKISAQVIEVISMSSSRGVGKVDREGGIEGKSAMKSYIERVGVAAGIGAVIGGIARGGGGAVSGAALMGACQGLGRQIGEDIQLGLGQQLLIRTAGDATIQ